MYLVFQGDGQVESFWIDPGLFLRSGKVLRSLRSCSEVGFAFLGWVSRCNGLECFAVLADDSQQFVVH